MEQFIRMKRELFMSKLDKINDILAVEYKKQEIFQFFLGYRDISLNLPENIKDMQIQSKVVNQNLTKNDEENDDRKDVSQIEYSHILTQMINVARMNKNKSKHSNQCTDDIKYFSTYIFLLCGRTCYETLN